MAQISQTGSSGEVGFNPLPTYTGDVGSPQKVAPGNLEGGNLQVSQGEANVIGAGDPRALSPTLDNPRELSPSEIKNAVSQVSEIESWSAVALESTKELLANINQGALTPEQVEKLSEYSLLLTDTSEYVDVLKGKGVDTPEGLKSVLAGLGFNESQREALLSLASPEDAGSVLAAKHGGPEALESKIAALSSLGFNDSQIDAILALAKSDPDGSALSSLQAESKPGEVLVSFGFSKQQAERLLDLLQDMPSAVNSNHRQLLMQAGLKEGEVDAVLSVADPDMAHQQSVLINTDAPQVAPYLKGGALGFNLLAAGNTFTDPIVEQLVDIFAVMELLHEMSVVQRRASRESRAVQYDAAKNEILNQAAEMKSAAVSNAVAGWVGAGAKMAGGLAQGGMSMKPAPKGSSVEARAAHTQAWTSRGAAFNQMVTAGGDGVKTGYEFKAAMHNAQVKEHEAYQKTHENAAQSESEFMNMHQDFVKTIVGKMDEIIKSWFETQKSATRG